MVSVRECSSSCVLQEVSAALRFRAPVPTAEQQLLRLLRLFLPHLWRKGFVLPIPSLTGEVRVLLSLQILTVSLLLLAPGSLGKTARAPRSTGGLPCPNVAVTSDRSSLMSAAGALCSPLQLQLRLGFLLLFAFNCGLCQWGEYQDVTPVPSGACSSCCRSSGSQHLI